MIFTPFCHQIVDILPYSSAESQWQIASSVGDFAVKSPMWLAEFLLVMSILSIER